MDAELPLMLDIWRSISTRKPFITAMTTIKSPDAEGNADQREAGDDRDEAPPRGGRAGSGRRGARRRRRP
jgi:hypothetical protein